MTTFTPTMIEKIAVSLIQLRTASGLLKPKTLHANIDLINQSLTGPKKPFLMSYNKNLPLFAEQYSKSIKQRPANKIKKFFDVLKNPRLNEAFIAGLNKSKNITNIKGNKKGVIIAGASGARGAINSILEGQLQTVSALKKAKGFTPKALLALSGGKKKFKEMTKLKKHISNMDAKNKEAFNRIGLLHEGFETDVKNIDWTFGHASPSVLHKEHNIITTLPEELTPAGDAFRMLRNVTGESKQLRKMNKGFEYGKSPRVSRHLIKKMEKENIQKHSLSRRILGMPQESVQKINPNTMFEAVGKEDIF